MAIKRDFAEKLMGAKGTLVSSSFSVIPDGYLGLVDDNGGRHLAVVCGEKSEWNKAWKGEEFETADEHKKIKIGMFPLNPNNAALVRRLVGWAAPSSCGVGLDRNSCKHPARWIRDRSPSAVLWPREWQGNGCPACKTRMPCKDKV